MKRNRWIRRFVIIVAVLFVVSRIVYVNRKYPQVEYKDIPIGETAEWDQNVNLTVEAAKVYNQAEAVDKYGPDIVDAFDNGADFVVVESKVLLSNQNDKEQEVYLYDLNIENRIYSNAIPQEVQLNTEDDNLVIDLQPKEERAVKICYKLFVDQFRNLKSYEIRAKDFWISGKHYPVKNRWKLG